MDNKDSQDQQPGEETLHPGTLETNELWALISESVRDYAIFTTDLERWVTSWNAGAQAILGYHQEQIVGQLADCIFTPEDQRAGAPQQEAQTALRKGKAEDERWHIRQDGSRLYGSGMTTPLRDEAGMIIGLVKVMRDLTAQKLAEEALRASEHRYRQLATELDQQVQTRTQELERLVAELRRTNANLELFAAVASHDLQAPLRKVLQFGDLLRREHGDRLGPGGAYLERMQTAASRMSRLITDLLTFSRLTSEPVHKVPVSLSSVLESVLSDLEVVIEESGAELRIDPLPMVEGDPTQLGQLFANLLTNALKFRRADQPLVISVGYQSVEAAEVPAGLLISPTARVYHHIAVADNGIGFDEQYRDRIFQA